MNVRLVDHATAHRAALIAAIWVPLAIVLASEAVIVAIGLTGSPQLIVDWGSSHRRTGPWWTYAVLVAAIGVPVIALMGTFIARATRMAGMNAWMPAIAVGLTVFHAVGMGVGSVVLNASPLAPALPLGGGLVLALAAALLTWRLLPREAPGGDGLDVAAPLPVMPGEVAAWTGRADLPAWFASLIAAIAGALIVVGVLLILTVGGRSWLVLLSPAALLVVLLATAQFFVTAGPRGLLVRGTLGWPRLDVPADSIARAGTVQVEPLSDFGGWGFRWVIGSNHRGRWGVITRRGAALEVVRRDGRSVVVTVDDAATAAAVLETYVGRGGRSADAGDRRPPE